ncbi:MAG: tRNA-intron lyase, partial [Candidatus Bathyarchaeia archaeon]
KVSFKKLQRRARKLYEEFDLKYAVYRDLRDKDLIVTPGMKYGCDFAVYKHGPGIDHAPYMVSVRKAEEEVTATDIVKAGRLATTVRKRFIIAIPALETEQVQYLIFKWFKA